MEHLQEQFWNLAQDHLPPAVCDALYTFLGHLSTVFYALTRAFTWAYKSASGTQQVETLSLAEQVVPPLLSIFAIYFGLVSIYRTTASFVRTVVSLIKWASIIALLAMGLGYFVAQGGVENPLGLDMMLRVASELVNGQTRIFAQPENAAGGNGPRGGSYGGRTRTERGERQKPGIFDSFLKHQEWKDTQNEEVLEYVDKVVNNAQRAYEGGSKFWNIFFKPQSNVEKDDGYGKTPNNRKTRSQTRRGKST
ncbi:hypothetical protein FRC14_005007 [Serendipita sp. 396]|nr:hypothetical protein FRC14_005007 [Serendipita sp. 396]KAG8790512.1 hypothetical protein FRC16_000840 [Serendipita sp. 398]KAG8813117.1 hypothetical protein FRC19_002659 [Serendipita sp. 401]KAG8864417.1 hypothetical protein FRC20_010231 [Serendipita sp. 405]KAG9053328.1 hypothetical protein FS842_008342 [Serendipita sp. 407]